MITWDLKPEALGEQGMVKMKIKKWSFEEKKRFPMKIITWYCSECEFEGTAKEFHKHKCDEWTDDIE